MVMFELEPLNPRPELLPSGAGVFLRQQALRDRMVPRLMPKRITAQCVEVSLKRCRRQAATLDDELLFYLIDITLLHLRRKAARPENNATMGAIRSSCATVLH